MVGLSPKFQKRELTTDQPLGKQLRAVRRTAKLSLEQVEMATKIRKKFLRSIEDGNYDDFPGEVYVRGFLENYAQFLGFPADEVLTQYKRERGISRAPESSRKLEIPRAAAPESRVSITPRTLWLGVGALSLFIVVGYIVSQLFGFASPPDLEIRNPGTSATVASETVEVEGKTDPGAELSINNQPVPTDADGNFKERVRLQPGANTLRIAAKNKTGKENIITRSVLVQTAQGSPTPTPALPATPLLLTLKIGPNSAYVTVNVDGAVAFQGLLAANTEQSFPANTRILLTTSNAGSTRVLINGQDRGLVGPEGQFRRGIEFLPSQVASPAPSPGG